MSNLAEAVAAWPQEGANDAMHFYERNDFKRLLDGSAYMVVGPKGSGKSSLVTYVDRHCRTSGHLCHQLHAQGLNFSRIAATSDEPTELSWFWRQVLMLSAISALNRDRLNDSTLAEQIPLTSDIGEIASVLRRDGFKLSYGGIKLEPSASSMWEDRGYDTKKLLAKIGQSLNEETTVFLTIDRLDLGFSVDQSPEQRRAYLRALSELVNATQAMTEEPAHGGFLKVQPIVLLRTDILAHVPSADRTKRSDMTVRLFWHPGEIQKLLAHRISVDAGLPPNEFARNWNALLFRFKETMEDRFDGKIQKPPFAWLEFRTQWRPRDYIYYLQVAASLALERGMEQIHFDQFVQAERKYSEYVRDQVIDEGIVQIPDIQRRFTELGAMVSPKREDKMWFNWQDFAGAFGEEEASVKPLLQDLYRVGAVGQAADNPVDQHPNTRFRFSYKQQHETELDSTMRQLIVHPALRRALIQ